MKDEDVLANGLTPLYGAKTEAYSLPCGLVVWLVYPKNGS